MHLANKIITKKAELRFEGVKLDRTEVYQVWEKVRGEQLASLRYDYDEEAEVTQLQLFPFKEIAQETLKLPGRSLDTSKTWGRKFVMLGAPVMPGVKSKDEQGRFIQDYWMPIKRSVRKEVAMCYLEQIDLETGERSTAFDLIVDSRSEQADDVLDSASQQLATCLRQLVMNAPVDECPAAQLISRLEIDLLFALIGDVDSTEQC